MDRIIFKNLAKDTLKAFCVLTTNVATASWRCLRKADPTGTGSETKSDASSLICYLL
jgi:hypothetical protein